MALFTAALAEAALIARLKEALETEPRLQATVMAHPGSLSKVPMGAVADVFVKYKGSTGTPPARDPRGPVTQTRSPKITVLLRIRDVSEVGAHLDAYNYLRRMDDAVSGWSLFEVTEATAFAWESESLVDEDEDAGIWLWEQVFTMSHPHTYSMRPVPPPEEP